MIIAFSGVDCAGKSTQIELLRQHFVSQGKTCTVFWYRPGYSRELEACKSVIRGAGRLACSLRGLRGGAGRGRESSEGMSGGEKRQVPAPLWLTTAILDSAFQYAVKLRLLARKYDVVICDRYVRDARLDLSFKYPGVLWPEGVFTALTALFPRPDVSILLWIPYEACLARAEAKQEPFPDDEHTRYLRWRAYDFYRDDPDVHVIGSEDGVEETHRRILECL